MKLFFHKLRKYKIRYISLVLALVIVQGIVFFSVNLLRNMMNELFPETIFPVENLYQCDILYYRSNTKPELVKLVSDEKLHSRLEAIDGIQKVGGAGLSRLEKRISSYNCSNDLDSTLKTFQVFAGYGFEKIFPVNFLKGKEFSDADWDGDWQKDWKEEVILTETLAKKLNLFNKELPVLVSLPTSYVDQKWRDYYLCGIIEDLGYYNRENPSEAVYPLIFKSFRDCSVLRIEEGADLYKIEKEIEQAVRPLTQDSEPNVQIVDLSSRINDDWEEMKSTIIPMLSIIPIVMLYVLIAMFGLFWTDMKRKKTDYGIMRAVGFSRRIIFRNLISEAFLLVVFAGVVSLLLMLNFSGDLRELFKGLSGYLGMWPSWTISIAFVMVLVLLASIFPALKTTRIQPVEALAEE
ncbi:ABC transporter permease [Draconibacterium sediminis]|uniref:ABC transporter permease n=1 Tax=Draconibacterium sediminis TaxID=1544798 RepID=UPI0026EFE450|nr:ABC transporter permease [Draconibacterium sediminis]